jgi:hypothetical protein
MKNKAEEKRVAVILRKSGVVAVGKYERDKVYKVTTGEAARLIEAKGFIHADTETIME